MGRVRGAKGRTAPEPPSPAAEAGVSSSRAPQVNNLVEPEAWEAGGGNRDAPAAGPRGGGGGGGGRGGSTIRARDRRCTAK